MVRVFLFFAAGWLPFVGWLLGGFLVSGVCFASAPSRGVLFSLLWALALLRWCGWVFCVRLVVHSLFGFVTELIIVKHRDSPACFSGWQGFSVSRGGGVSSCTVGCGFALRWCVGAYGGCLACRVAQVCRGACVCD